MLDYLQVTVDTKVAATWFVFGIVVLYKAWPHEFLLHQVSCYKIRKGFIMAVKISTCKIKVRVGRKMFIDSVLLLSLFDYAVFDFILNYNKFYYFLCNGNT